ncbi:MAG TPA: hypothetical protein VF719_01975 [Abditibacteriaceae bacterium]|jgi:hypothetical protein
MHQPGTDQGQQPYSSSTPIPSPTGEMSHGWNAPSTGANDSGQGAQSVLPAELKGFSWAAFLMNGIWSIGHNTWIGLISFVPYVGFIMAFVLGFKGNEWAWQNRKWDSIEHFKKTQRVWTIWGVALTLLMIIGFIGFGILAASFAARMPAGSMPPTTVR